MATSQTTNLQLTKYGAGTDNLLRSDFNDNMDKIDTFAGSTNQAIVDLNNPSTTADILASAVSVSKVTVFKGNGSSYTGTLPSAIYRYGIFVVTPRDSNRIVQAVADGAYAVNYYNGSTWNGWKEFALNAPTYIGGSASLDALKSNLLTIANGMAANTTMLVSAYPQFSGSAFAYQTGYYGYLNCMTKSGSTATEISVTFQSALGDLIAVGYKNSTWSIEQLANNLEEISPDSGTTNKFTIPAKYHELFIQATFSAGQKLLFNLPVNGTRSLRQDSGFYYSASACGGGCISWDVGTRKIEVLTPYYGGSATSYTSIICMAK